MTTQNIPAEEAVHGATKHLAAAATEGATATRTTVVTAAAAVSLAGASTIPIVTRANALEGANATHLVTTAVVATRNGGIAALVAVVAAL